MVSTGTSDDDKNLVRRTLEWIADAGINGLGVLPSAEAVAADHLSKAASVEDAINSVIAWRTTYAAGTGFITGLGGIVAMPITIPAGLATSYALGANTAAAIAHLRGYDIHSEQVRTMVLLCLIGEAGEEILKNAGIAIGTKLCQNLIKKMPGKVLIEINKKIGFRLIAKAGEKSVITLTKMVPLVGGFVGGTFDSLFVKSCGHAAKKLFSQNAPLGNEHRDESYEPKDKTSGFTQPEQCRRTVPMKLVEAIKEKSRVYVFGGLIAISIVLAIQFELPVTALFLTEAFLIFYVLRHLTVAMTEHL
jgi:EcsC protein family